MGATAVPIHTASQWGQYCLGYLINFGGWGGGGRVPCVLCHLSGAPHQWKHNLILLRQGIHTVQYYFSIYKQGDIFGFFSSVHYFICRPSDSTVSEDAGNEPRTVATLALAVRRSNQAIESHSMEARYRLYLDAHI